MQGDRPSYGGRMPTGSMPPIPAHAPMPPPLVVHHPPSNAPQWVAPSIILSVILAVGGWVFTYGSLTQRVEQLERDRDAAARAATELAAARRELAELRGILRIGAPK